MLVKDFRRLVLIVGPVVVLSILSIGLWQAKSEFFLDQYDQLRGKPPPPDSPNEEQQKNLGSIERPRPLPPPSTWNEILSVSTPNRTFFEIRFGDIPVFNPNILPHPTEDDTWILMGQKWVSHEDVAVGLIAYEMGCNAKFVEGELRCIEDPEPLPIEPTVGGLCEGKWEMLNLNVGPHDARAFYGPSKPYAIYGSNSDLVCFGQWIQDFRGLVPSAWKAPLTASGEDTSFLRGTELHRPPPSHPIEKNYFVFWDAQNQMHAHYDMFPDRSLARLNEKDGTVGANLAPASAKQDAKCLAKYLPSVAVEFESIHQATNSLKITLCNRSDHLCRLKEEENTFIMTIIQHKSYYSFHSEYEPYVVLFKQTAPYQVYGVSKKPLWISGRSRQEEMRRTDMLYVTSMAWKEKGMKYHGFLDDVLFLGFGVEDKRAGGIDVLVGDLVGDLGMCEEV